LPLTPSDVVLVLTVVVGPPSLSVVVVELFLVVLPTFLISCSASSSIVVRVGTAAMIAGVGEGAMVVHVTSALVSRAEHWSRILLATNQRSLLHPRSS